MEKEEKGIDGTTPSPTLSSSLSWSSFRSRCLRLGLPRICFCNCFTSIREDDEDEQETSPPPSRMGISIMNSLPNEMIVTIMTYLDVRTLVEIKPVSHQFQILSTTAIDSKGIIIGTRTQRRRRKAFETNEELRHAVQSYCPVPRKGRFHDENIKQQQYYCHRYTAEHIACTYGWPMNKWNVSKIEDFINIFYSETRYMVTTLRYEPIDEIYLFNESITNWNTSNAKTMEYMFHNATHFNQPLNSWNVSNVTSMKGMFRDARTFNQDLSKWNVSNVTTMEEMFYATFLFNHNISLWNVSNVINMSGMFHYAKQFNSNISCWNVSNVVTMENMFHSTNQFNQNISIWNISNVINMSGMFHSTNAFDQNLSLWNISNNSIVHIKKIFYNAKHIHENDVLTWGEQWTSNDIIHRMGKIGY